MALKNLYDSPDDVDLFVGGLIEPPVPGGVVGYTFREIIAEQFSRFKSSDRYFYDLHPDINPGHFTKCMLKQKQNMTASWVEIFINFWDLMKKHRICALNTLKIKQN